MVNMPTYYPKDKFVVVRMLKDLVIMNWSYDGKFKLLKKNTLYKLPVIVGLALSEQNYCYYLEGIKQ